MNDNPQLQKHIDTLIALLKIPSVCALPEHKEDMKKAALFLEDQMKQIGLQNIAEYHAKGHEAEPPIVFGERIDDPKNPTILVYGHYDVQPADPLDEWKKPPFEPVIENGNIYGRGTTDDKGQLMTHLAALAELSQEWGDTWPVNIKIIFEGQEEMSGVNLHAWVQEPAAKELLKSDVVVVADTGFAAQDQPTIFYGIRGIVYFQIDVTLADHDIHSGVFGGILLNPIHALVEMLQQLYDAKTGKVLVPGFYDDVLDLDQEEKDLLAKVPFDGKQLLKDAGNAYALHGEEGFTPKEQLCARPTFDVNGIWGGFTGDGAKTIIPGNAHAKFSCRLVPNQDPEKIAGYIKEYLNKIAPKEVQVKITHIHTGYGILIDRDSPWMHSAVQALKDTFGVEPVFDRSGASVPAIADFKNFLGLETLMFGYSLPDDNLHAPNEKYNLQQFEKGIQANKRFYQNCAKVKK